MQTLTINPPLNVSVYGLLDSYLKYLEKVDGRSKSTILNRKYILRDFVRFYKSKGSDNIYRIQIDDVDEYIISKQYLKTSSVNLIKQAIKHFLYYCQFHRGIEIGLDFQLIRRQKEVPPKVVTFSRDEIKQVLKNCNNDQDKLVIAVLFETGMRIGEVVNLSVHDIRGTEIRVRGKGSKDRTVYITNDLARALRNHITTHRLLDGCVFRHQMTFSNLITDTYTTSTLRDRIQRQFERSEIHMHPHQLRHSFAIEWLTNGGDVRTLQKILGHSSLEITMRYLQTTDNYTQQAYQKTIQQSVI